jgi:UDP-glucuronate 4-epimerase
VSRSVVTGAAGFIGSFLAEALANQGQEVLGIDCLSDYYDPALKRANLGALAREANFEFRPVDIASDDLEGIIGQGDTVFHLAAQAGIRSSWSKDFAAYVHANVLGTQRLLDCCSRHSVHKVVYASSSSVYGNAERYPTVEDFLPAPQSPYGVTKLAGEHLCRLYAETHRVSALCLRYHTVYGPRQRPDMAIYRIIDSCLHGTEYRMFGDGSYVRDFTFVSDIVAGTIAAGASDVGDGRSINLAGGSSISMRELVRDIETLTGTAANVRQEEAQPGDVARTGGSIELARQILGWAPAVDLHDGLARQIAWQRRAPIDLAGPNDRC